jgi:ribonuclease P protein component
MKPNGLPRHEKLKSRSDIDALFQRGQRFSVYPVLTWYRSAPADGKGGLEAGFSCSKKHFKKAVDRNRAKRLMREAWRLQKSTLLSFVQENGLQLQVFLIFLDKTLPDYETIYAAIGKSIQQLKKKTHEAAH